MPPGFYTPCLSPESFELPACRQVGFNATGRSSGLARLKSLPVIKTVAKNLRISQIFLKFGLCFLQLRG